MPVLLDIDHEAGDLSEYNSTTTDGGDLSAAAGAALNSTSFGLQCVIDDTNTLRGQSAFTWAQDILTVEFYFDPNSMTDFGSAGIDVLDCIDAGARIGVIVRGTAAGSFTVQYQFGTDPGLITSGLLTITDAPHRIVLIYTRASSPTSSNGSFEVLVDNVTVFLSTGRDIFDVPRPTDLRVGAAAVPAAASGTFYLDEFVVSESMFMSGARAIIGGFGIF